MALLRIIYRALSLFEAHTSSRQLSLSILMGMLLGFSSPTSLQWWVFAAMLFLFRVNLLTLAVSWLSFESLFSIFTPQLDRLGYFLLSNRQLTPFWAKLYHMPLVPFTRFNMTTLLGAEIVGLILMIPLFIASHGLVKKLSPLVYHTWRTTKLYRLYVFYKPYTR